MSNFTVYLNQTRRSRCAYVIFCLFMYHIYVWVQEGESRIGRDGAGVSIMQIGQSSNSMGLRWKGFGICASTTTTSRQGYFTLKRMMTYTHLYLSCFVHNAVYFSLLQVNNIPHEGTANVHLFLELLTSLRTLIKSIIFVKSMPDSNPEPDPKLSQSRIRI
jgi:hypothetical protein